MQEVMQQVWEVRQVKTWWDMAIPKSNTENVII